MAPSKNSSASTAVKAIFSPRQTRSMASRVKLTKSTSVSPPSTTPPVVPATRRSLRLSSHGSPQLRRSPRLSSHRAVLEKMPSPSVVSKRRELKPKIPISHTWKCLVVGNDGVGKDTFMKRSMGDPSNIIYKRTKDKGRTKFYPISFRSSRGWLTFNVYDTVGQEGSRVLHENVYKGRDCGIIIFDLMSESSYIKKIKWYTGLKYNFAERAARGRPCSMVLVGTNDDLDGPQKLNTESIRKHHVLPMGFVSLSLMTNNQNLHHPYLLLAQDLLADKNLEFLPVRPSHKKALRRQGYDAGMLGTPP